MARPRYWHTGGLACSSKTRSRKKPADMLIRVEVTPNPAAKRFLLPRPLALEEPIAFDRSSERRPRIAQRLLEIEGVTDLLFAREFIAVSRDSTAKAWPDLQFEIVGEIIEALAEGEAEELSLWSEQQFSSDDPVEVTRGIGDFIAGMTDRYAVRRYEELFGPSPLHDL